jgi:hypothetical protein
VNLNSLLLPRKSMGWGSKSLDFNPGRTSIPLVFGRAGPAGRPHDSGSGRPERVDPPNGAGTPNGQSPNAGATELGLAPITGVASVDSIGSSLRATAAYIYICNGKEGVLWQTRYSTS